MDFSLPLATTSLGAQSRAVLNNAEAGSKDALKVKAQQAAEEFEAVFLNTMLEGMFSGIKTDGPLGGGPGEKTYRSLLVNEYAKNMAGDGGIGLADHVYREVLAAQESANK